MKCNQVSHTHEIPKLVSKDLQFNYPFNIWKVFECCSFSHLAQFFFETKKLGLHYRIYFLYCKFDPKKKWGKIGQNLQITRWGEKPLI
jgi:hypothetical protein